jgi:hypothetical protein
LGRKKQRDPPTAMGAKSERVWPCSGWHAPSAAVGRKDVAVPVRQGRGRLRTKERSESCVRSPGPAPYSSAVLKPSFCISPSN